MPLEFELTNPFRASTMREIQELSNRQLYTVALNNRITPGHITPERRRKIERLVLLAIIEKRAKERAHEELKREREEKEKQELEAMQAYCRSYRPTNVTIPESFTRQMFTNPKRLNPLRRVSSNSTHLDTTINPSLLLRSSYNPWPIPPERRKSYIPRRASELLAKLRRFPDPPFGTRIQNIFKRSENRDSAGRSFRSLGGHETTNTPWTLQANASTQCEFIQINKESLSKQSHKQLSLHNYVTDVNLIKADLSKESYSYSEEKTDSEEESYSYEVEQQKEMNLLKSILEEYGSAHENDMLTENQTGHGILLESETQPILSSKAYESMDDDYQSVSTGSSTASFHEVANTSMDVINLTKAPARMSCCKKSKSISSSDEETAQYSSFDTELELSCFNYLPPETHMQLVQDKKANSSECNKNKELFQLCHLEMHDSDSEQVDETEYLVWTRMRRWPRNIFTFICCNRNGKLDALKMSCTLMCFTLAVFIFIANRTSH